MDERLFLDGDLNVEGEAEHSAGGSTIALFLSLFLLILAFFILLVTISTIEDVKSKAGKDSLSSAFKSIAPPTTNPTEFASKDGDFIAGQQFQEQIDGIFATELQVAKVEVVQPGRLMRVKFPTNNLYVGKTAEINSSAFALLDRIVATLSAPPPGLRFDMELVIGSPYAPKLGLPIEQTLEMARVGSFARIMTERGLPPGRVAIGIMPGNTEDVTIWFYTRDEAEQRPELDLTGVTDDE